MSVTTHDDISPRDYALSKGWELSKKTQVRKDNYRIPCPACGKYDACDMNVRTGQWKCLRSSCEQGGGFYKMRTLLNDAYDIEKPVERKPFNVERFEADLVKAFRETRSDSPAEGETIDPVELWHRDLLTADAAAPARKYLEERGITEDVIKLAKLGWASSPPGNASEPVTTSRRKKSPAARRKKPAAARAVPASPESSSSDEKPQRPPKGKAAAKRRSRRASAPQKRTGPGSGGLITIPYFEDGKVVLVKLRWVPPEPVDGKNGKVRRYQRIAGGRTVLYQPFGPIDPEKPVVLVGGEFDALSAGVALLELGESLNVAATSAGEGGWSEEFGDELDAVEDLIVIYDSDAGGRGGAKKVAEAMGRHRVRIGKWPEGHNDANDALRAGDLEGFSMVAVMRDAVSPVAAAVATAAAVGKDYLARRADTSRAQSWTTGHKDMDNLTGGIRGGEATVYTGETGIGKTTFVLEIVDNGAKAGIPSLLCPFEDGKFAYIEKVLRRETGLRPATIADDEVMRILELRPNLWILDHYGEVKPGPLRSTMLYAMRRLGIRAFMFDHIDYMAKRGRGEAEAKDVLIHTIQSTIRDSPAHAHILAHPSKSPSNESKGTKDQRVIQLADVKGHSTVVQDFANVCSVWRPRRMDRSAVKVKDTDEPDNTVVAIWLKARHNDGREGSVKVLFDPKTETYKKHPYHFNKPIAFNPANPTLTDEDRAAHEKAQEEMPL